MKTKIKGEQYKFLLTNFHVSKKEFVDLKKEIKIFYGKKSNEKMKTIKLDINKRKIRCFQKPKDVTVIQIIESDNIPDKKFLFPDLNYKNGFDDYINENFYLAGYPYSNIFKYERHISSGKIKKIKNFEFEHSLDTKKSSSGSPICLIYNQNVIGIHKSGDYKNNVNQGTFIGIILDLLENEKNFDISRLKLIKTIHNTNLLNSIIILNDGRPCTREDNGNIKIYDQNNFDLMIEIYSEEETLFRYLNYVSLDKIEKTK